ncbi:MAG: hypothetical protein GF387_03510 [Candidatus Portnoybacteria bacterium]|nr:hypothetical protein [Candidatus Portnoybacteria bacterium]
MNKKTLITLIMILLIAFAAGGVYYFILAPKEPIEETDGKKEISNDQFSVKLPEGWQEGTPPAGSLAIAINSSEEITDPKAQEINFRSYYSIIQDVLGDMTKEEYIEKVKESLMQSSGDLKIIKEETTTINNRPVYYLHLRLIQQEINFRVLLSLIIDQSNVWIISSNTLEENWEQYRDLFYNISESFQIKVDN